MLRFSLLRFNNCDRNNRKCITEGKKYIFYKILSWYNNKKKKKNTSMFNRVIRGYIIKHYCSIGYRCGDRINPMEEWILLKDNRKQNAKPCRYIILSCSSYYYYYYLSRVLQTRVWVWQMDVRQWSLRSDSVDFIARITLSHELPRWCNVNYIHYGAIRTYAHAHSFLTYNHII